MKLSFRINKPPDFVFDYLTDVQKYVSVHPVITKIKSTGENSYLIYETLRFLGIPISFTYPATVEGKRADNTVVMRAVVKKLTKIEMTFVLKAEKDFTLIEENIEFKSPLPVRRTMQRIFRKQHEQLFRNIELVK